MEYEPTFIKEEVRCDFLVTETRKKIWYIEIEMLIKFDEVCKKHHLTYFADYGTLLGAVRHQGFVPWDDDIDITMRRDDYAKFQEIARMEFQEPYYYQDSYNSQQIWALSKIRDSRTTAIEFPDYGPEFNQGIFLDIYPLDDISDGDFNTDPIFAMKRELWLTIVQPQDILNSLANGTKFMFSADILVDLIKLPIRERFQQFESFNLAHFGNTKYMDFVTRPMCYPWIQCRERAWYADVLYVPFEYITVPIPVGYDKLLRCNYGDYHVYIQGGSNHMNIFTDPDTPYQYYLEHPEKMH